MLYIYFFIFKATIISRWGLNNCRYATAEREREEERERERDRGGRRKREIAVMIYIESFIRL